ncbi:MAG: S41 family peptidase [Bacteroidota bacterium]
MKYLLFFMVVMCSGICYSQTTVTFQVNNVENSKFKYVGIRGGQAPLNWSKSTKMTKTDEGYSVSVTFEEDVKTILFKYVLYNSDSKIEWESIPNRLLRIGKQSEISVNHRWNKGEAVDVKKLSKIPSDGLMKDFELIKTMILDVHPGTYRYADEAKIDSALEELKRQFKSDLTYGEAYLAISKVLGAIQCDHTFASFYNQSNVVKAVIHEQRDKLPFTFLWIDNKMIVEFDASDASLPKGTEVVSINGYSSTDILNQIMPYAKADGATDKSRVKQIEIDGYPYRHNAFDVFHPLLFPANGKFELVVNDPDGKTKSLTVLAITREERSKLLKSRYPEFAYQKEGLWGYEKINESTGIIRAGTFDDYGMDMDWRKYFSTTFKQINQEKIKHLIVDLRKNQGGFDEIALGLIQHLVKKEGLVEDFIGKSRYKDFPESLKPYAKSWGDPWFHQMEVVSAKDSEGYYLLAEENDEVVKPAKNAFKGEIYFLVGPANVSMAFYLATGIKKYNIGTLIGDETGGNQRGINGGQILFLRLPNSKIEIDFPVEGSFAKEENLPNSGIMPDLEVSTTIADIRAGRDPQLEAALDLIKEKSGTISGN